MVAIKPDPDATGSPARVSARRPEGSNGSSGSPSIAGLLAQYVYSPDKSQSPRRVAASAQAQAQAQQRQRRRRLRDPDGSDDGEDDGDGGQDAQDAQDGRDGQDGIDGAEAGHGHGQVVRLGTRDRKRRRTAGVKAEPEREGTPTPLPVQSRTATQTQTKMPTPTRSQASRFFVKQEPDAAPVRPGADEFVAADKDGDEDEYTPQSTDGTLPPPGVPRGGPAALPPGDAHVRRTRSQTAAARLEILSDSDESDSEVGGGAEHGRGADREANDATRAVRTRPTRSTPSTRSTRPTRTTRATRANKGTSDATPIVIDSSSDLSDPDPDTDTDTDGTPAPQTPRRPASAPASAPGSATGWRRPRTYADPHTGAYAHISGVPDHLRQDLDVVFIGINPGTRSGTSGHFFAHPTNKFWKALYGAGFTERLYTPNEDGTLLRRGVGLTNLVDRVTAQASELSGHEQRLAVAPLSRKLARYAPRVACFVGKMIWDTYAGVLRRSFKERENRERNGGGVGAGGYRLENGSGNGSGNGAEAGNGHDDGTRARARDGSQREMQLATPGPSTPRRGAIVTEYTLANGVVTPSPSRSRVQTMAEAAVDIKPDIKPELEPEVEPEIQPQVAPEIDVDAAGVAAEIEDATEPQPQPQPQAPEVKEDVDELASDDEPLVKLERATTPPPSQSQQQPQPQSQSQSTPTPTPARPAKRSTSAPKSTSTAKTPVSFDTPQTLRLVSAAGQHTYFWVVPNTSGLERTPLAQQVVYFSKLKAFADALARGEVPAGEFVDVFVPDIEAAVDKLRAAGTRA